MVECGHQSLEFADDDNAPQFVVGLVGEVGLETDDVTANSGLREQTADRMKRDR